jgi:hypothetical protein
MATKKKLKKTVSKKKPVSKAKKQKRLSKKQLFQKRSQAAKKGWVTRRGISVSREGIPELKKKIAELEEDLRRKQELIRKGREVYEEQFKKLKEVEGLEQHAEAVMERYKHHIAMDQLPPRMIHETALQHAHRVVKAMKAFGYNADQGYEIAARHTGLSAREVYTMFMYVGPGEFVA